MTLKCYGEGQLNKMQASLVFLFMNKGEKQNLKNSKGAIQIHASQLSISLLISVCTNGYFH